MRKSKKSFFSHTCYVKIKNIFILDITGMKKKTEFLHFFLYLLRLDIIISGAEMTGCEKSRKLWNHRKLRNQISTVREYSLVSGICLVRSESSPLQVSGAVTRLTVYRAAPHQVTLHHGKLRPELPRRNSENLTGFSSLAWILEKENGFNLDNVGACDITEVHAKAHVDWNPVVDMSFS